MLQKQFFFTQTFMEKKIINSDFKKMVEQVIENFIVKKMNQINVCEK